MHSACLRFRLHLSLNGRMGIWLQKSCRITIRKIWKSLPNGNSVTVLSPNCHLAVRIYPNLTNGIQQLFCLRIAIRPFTLKLKRKWNRRYFENTFDCKKEETFFHFQIANSDQLNQACFYCCSPSGSCFSMIAYKLGFAIYDQVYLPK